MANRKHLTERDLKMVSFITDNNLVITSDQASRMFYRTESNNQRSALTIAQRRLTTCVKLKHLKRMRDHIDDHYIYYSADKPKQVNHKLMITEFIVHMSQKYKILNVDVEYKGLLDKYALQPDIKIDFMYGKHIITLFVECENTKIFTGAIKYKRVFEDIKDGYLKNVIEHDCMVVCTSRTNPKNSFFNPIWIDEKLSNFSVLEHRLLQVYELKQTTNS